MTIHERIAASSPTLSFELYPPRTPDGQEALCETIAKLAGVGPDFVSVTYGASGSTRDSSREVVRRLAKEHTIPPLAHLTCVSASRAELAQIVEEFLAEGVRGFLALRGDPPQGEPDWRPHPDGLLYASQLVALIREVAGAKGLGPGQISIGVAASPAAHADERWRDQGLEVLQAKQEAGADFAITQIFFEAGQYLDLAEDARTAGITIPLLPGIIPIPSPARASRLEQLTGVPVPLSLLEALASAPDDDAARAIGVVHATALAQTVLDSGAPGIHVYTFNRHKAALELVEALGLGPSARKA
ncbi:MAG: methylenetetrahydrofolate reductase [Demequinaceae bacterium]|nr:methylenetetrahydrofolate reductase [Demequinaceae bacterium]